MLSEMNVCFQNVFMNLLHRFFALPHENHIHTYSVWNHCFALFETWTILGSSNISCALLNYISSEQSLFSSCWLLLVWLSTLSEPSRRRKCNWEISRFLPSPSKPFSYILCSQTHHQLSGLVVFVLEDCMSAGVGVLSWQGL